MDIENRDIKMFLDGENRFSNTMQDFVLRLGVQIQIDLPNPLDYRVVDLRLKRLDEVKKEFDHSMYKEASKKWLQRLHDQGTPPLSSSQMAKEGMARAYPAFNLIKRAFSAGVDIPFHEGQSGKVIPSSRPKIMEVIKKREKERYSSPEGDRHLATLAAISENFGSALQRAWGCDLAPVERLSEDINSYLQLYIEKRSTADEVMQFASYLKGRTDLIASQNPPLPDEDDFECQSDAAR